MDFENLINLEIQDVNLIEDEKQEDEMQIHTPKRQLRDGQNPFEMYNEWEFKRKFRFSKNLVMFGVLPLVEEELAKVNNRSLPIFPVLQLLTRLRFYSTASFQELGYGPGAIGLSSIDGAIDCTHIRLVHTRLYNIEEIYRNRKGYFSLNVQVIVGPRTKILDIVSKWPGCEHDNRIFQNSHIYICDIDSKNLMKCLFEVLEILSYHFCSRRLIIL